MASSTSSSPIFERPFSEMHFSNADGRLRRRENDSVQRDPAATPLFAQSDATPYYSHTPRKRKSGVERWVPRLFKAILWSPVAVVVIWCISATLFTHTRSGRPRGGTNTVQVRPTSAARNAKMARHQQSRGGMMSEGGLVVAEVLESALGKEQPGLVPVVAPLGSASGQTPTGNRFTRFVQGVTNMVRPQQGNVIVQPANLYQQPALGSSGSGVYQQGVYQQQPEMQYEGIYQQSNADGTYQQQPNMGSSGGGVYQQGVYQQQPQMQYDGIYQQPNADGTYQQQPNMGSSGGGVYQQPNADGTYQLQPNMGSSSGNTGGVYQQPNSDGTFQQQPNMGSSSGNTGGVYQQPNADSSLEQQPNMGSNGGGGVYQQPDATGTAQNQPSMGSSEGGVYYQGIYQDPSADGTYQRPQMQATGQTSSNLRGSTQYLYYNPRDVVVMDGQVYLPSQAFDRNGRPHDLSRTQAQVYFQPPPYYGVHNFNHSDATSSSTTFVHPNTVKTPVMGSPPKGISVPSLPAQVDSNSSILVATVGVVALLVGALSARHARGRAFLNACLENENLVATEAAYDTAHTTASNTYSTFWKGDLEKFDV